MDAKPSPKTTRLSAIDCGPLTKKMSTADGPPSTDNPATLISGVLKFRFKTKSYNDSAVDY